jgi:hypothetical protein
MPTKRYLIVQRGRMEGFLVLDCMSRAAEAHFPSVFGTTRIGGGAAFEFSFKPNVNLLRRANFNDLGAETSFGFDMYEGEGTLLYAYTRPSIGPAVPEPATWSLIAFGFSAMALMARRRSTHTA